jgi:hypothetical protein
VTVKVWMFFKDMYDKMGVPAGARLYWSAKTTLGVLVISVSLVDIDAAKRRVQVN